MIPFRGGGVGTTVMATLNLGLPKKYGNMCYLRRRDTVFILHHLAWLIHVIERPNIAWTCSRDIPDVARPSHRRICSVMLQRFPCQADQHLTKIQDAPVGSRYLDQQFQIHNAREAGMPLVPALPVLVPVARRTRCNIKRITSRASHQRPAITRSLKLF